MAKQPAKLNFVTSPASLLSCTANQLIPQEDTKGGFISLTATTEVANLDGHDDRLLLTVKVKITGIQKETGAEAFFAECAYRQFAIFDGPAPNGEAIDVSEAERMLRPLYYLALNECQNLVWRLGNYIPRSLPEIELFKTPPKKGRPAATRGRRKTLVSSVAGS
ncbi:MAG: hypothetical protein HGA75_13385 [Thiobacillus sp.]|nr:hypothetical protein [Thiobacillus sp.]